jgi:hypothetical protein
VAALHAWRGMSLALRSHMQPYHDRPQSHTIATRGSAVFTRRASARGYVLGAFALATVSLAGVTFPSSALAQSNATDPRPSTSEGSSAPAGDQPVPATHLAPERAEPIGAGKAPIQQNLPDTASTEEVQGEYGWGLATLILGGALMVALVVGLFVSFSRKSWSAPS